MLWRIGLAGVLLVASACGAPTGATAAASPTARTVVAAPDRVLIEQEDQTQIVDVPSGRTVATLPAGLVAPTSDLVASLTPAGAATRVRATDLAGATKLDITLPGDYRFSNAYGPAPSGFSPNGKWLVLISRTDQTYPGDPLSRFAVIDVAGASLATTVELSSRFTFDAIHNDGSAMYLIEHPQPGATTYNVRLYDLRTKTLNPNIIFDKAAITQWDPTVGLMDGTFHVSVAPKSGDWSYGLYMRPNGKPFVHALNVPGKYAQCIVDLEGWWSPSSMFSLALTDDGQKLFVVDAVVGTVSVIDGLSQKVSRTATFKTTGIPGDPRSASAVVSRDGSRLYASAARGVAMLNTADLTLKAWVTPDVLARSLALSSDGSRLYALAGDAIVIVDAATGRILSQLAASKARAIRVLSAR